MVSRSTRRGIVVMFLLALLSFWLTRGGDGESAGPTEGLDTRLDYALEDFRARLHAETAKVRS